MAPELIAAYTRCPICGSADYWLEPLTAACCAPAEIRAMTYELFAAEAQFLKRFK